MLYVSYTRTTSTIEFKEPDQRIISIQNEHIKSYADEHGFKISEKYSDRKKSKDENSSFMDLLEDGMRREFDCVVIDSIFRAGKSFAEAEAVLLKTFYYAGINLIVVEDDFNSIICSKNEVEDYFKQKYEIDKGWRVAHKSFMNRLSGNISKRQIPYGYYVDEKGDVCINEAYASNVRLIFNMYENGKRLCEISKQLENTAQIIPAAVANPEVKKDNIYSWDLKTIRHILENVKYKGRFEFKCKDEEVVIEVPPIIDETVFENVQKLSEKSKRKKDVVPVENLFSRKVYDQTGEHIKLRNINGERFYLPKVKSNNKKNFTVKYEVVKDIVSNEIINEKECATRIKALIEQGKTEMYFNQELSKIQTEIRELFTKTAEREIGAIELDKSYKNGLITEDEYFNNKKMLRQMLMDEDYKYTECVTNWRNLKNCYSLNNGWINLMDKMDLSTGLTNEIVKKYIEKIIIYDCDDIKVIVKHHKWKQFFPEELIEVK